jgi:3-oxoacyl-[acyl-carrier-protein] synthase II
VTPVISAWSAVSPFGLERSDFAAGVRAGRRPDALSVPGFDAREVLGRKGTRSMDRLTALAVASTRSLMSDVDGVDDGVALVLGTTTGSAQSIMDFTRDSLTGEQPYHVDPARFPNTVLNCAAAQAAIWHGLRGPNATVAGGRAAGLLALNYARRLQRSGRADAVLCGAAEEYSPARATLAALAEPPVAADGLGEGCAMLLLEAAGRPARYGRAELASVLALVFGVADSPADVRGVLAGCLRRAFAVAGEDPARVWAVVRSGPASAGETAGEDAAIGDVLGGAAQVLLRGTDLFGDADAAASAFGLAAVLALTEDAPVPHDRTALVTAVDRDGAVGCAVLRLPGVPA